MKLKEHTAISLILSSILFYFFRSWKISLSCLITGIFIDIDHLIDYFIEYRTPFDFKKFFYIFYNKLITKARLLFHGWEWLILLSAIILFYGWNEWLLGIFIGYSQHIILDQLYNKPHKWGYFIIWRYKNNFLLSRTLGIMKEKNK